jgi:hypothetical protein
MPSADIKPSGKDDDPYWDLVNFVQALPYRHMLPENVRERVYPPSEARTEQHARAD